MLAAGIALAAFLVLLVIRPAIERGGSGELLLVAGFLAVVLLGERWLRSR